MTAVRLAVAACAGALVLGACSDGGAADAGEGGGGGVPFGATKAEYQKAFEDVAPIKVVAQTTGPKGLNTFSGRNQELYYAAIEEWSGGKISFDINYAFAIAPINEADNAVADGRLDVATMLPSLEPSEYPAFTEFVKGSMLSKDGMPVVGALHANAYLTDAGYQVPELFAEMKNHGIHMVTPAFPMTPNGVMCTKMHATLDDMKGSIVSTSSAVISAQMKAAGATPTSLPYTEAFEALQRGAIDCAASGLAITPSTGVTEIAPNAMFADGATLGSVPGPLGVRSAFWDDLPLVAKQLFYDRLDVFYDDWVGGQIAELANAVKVAEGYGGGAFPFSGDVLKVLRSENTKVLESIHDSKVIADPDAMVDALKTASEKWYALITGELGFDPKLSMADFPAWLESQGGKVDLTAFIDAMMSEIISKQRPS